METRPRGRHSSVVAMRSRVISVLNKVFGGGSRWRSFGFAACFALVFIASACEGDAPLPPPPAPSETPALSETPASKPAEEAKPEAPEPKAPPTTPSSAEVLAPTPTPVVDRADRQGLLLKHYKALRCLDARGGSPDLKAQAFVDSGLEPELWNQALGELLEHLKEEPEGEVAQEMRAIDQSPCSKEASP